MGTYGFGGAISVNSQNLGYVTEVLIQATTFRNNSAAMHGGAIYMNPGDKNAKITMLGRDNVFEGNRAGGDGMGCAAV